jgi:hypothetical protein
MRPVELGGSLVPGTGLTLIRKKLKCYFVLLRVVSYEDVPKKEQAWFGLKYCSYAVRDISTLLLLLENFFVWPSSAPRHGDAQNAAFDKIRELLKEMRQRYPLEPA